MTPELEATIGRALAKVPADRFATALEFAHALQRAPLGPSPAASRMRRFGPLAVAVLVTSFAVAAIWGPIRARLNSARPATEPPRIAVLYFDDRTATPSLRLLAEGLTEELIHELGGLNAFRVISRNGVRPFRARQVPFDSLVAALGVTTVIDGSVRRIGDTLRVEVDVIDAASGTNVDSVSVSRQMTDIASLEYELAMQVAAALRQRMGRDVRLRENAAGTTVGLARELVLRARRARDEAEAQMADPRPEYIALRRSRAQSG